MGKRLLALLCALLFSVLILSASASEITDISVISRLNKTYPNKYTAAKDIPLESEKGIAAVYIIFYDEPKSIFISNGEKEQKYDCRFLQQYVDIGAVFGETPKNLTISFDGAKLVGLFAFDDTKDLPDWVHIWETPPERADLLVFTAHADDEQLFFAGILPTYAGERGYETEVCYLSDNAIKSKYTDIRRRHELLDGLWTAGVKNYPVVLPFPDCYAKSIEQLLKQYAAYGITKETVENELTETVRRFKPQVIITHDPLGEYGHGAHKLLSSVMPDILKKAADGSYHTESAQKYGAWQVKKLYEHSYPENKITLDIDTPLKSFGGKTALEVSQSAFACHKTQVSAWFYEWLCGTKDAPIKSAAQIKKYSPINWGLVATTVGEDKAKNDIFENITSYAEQNEAARRQKEELERQAEEKAEKEKADIEKTKKKTEHKNWLINAAIVIVLLIIFFVFERISKKRK